MAILSVTRKNFPLQIIIYPTVIIPAFLAADFSIRAIQQSKYSPFFKGSVFLPNKMDINKKTHQRWPKNFCRPYRIVFQHFDIGIMADEFQYDCICGGRHIVIVFIS
jgi:hypothetical protein